MATSPSLLAMSRSFLFRRVILLPLLSILVLSAPLSWPVYSTCILLLNHVISITAHGAFRLYQLRDTGQPTTVVTSLMYFLSLIIQMAESNTLAIILLRLLAEEWSLSWYQNNPEVACLFVFPR
jgi:hypothetical protein